MNALGRQFEEALLYAAHVHARQVRKGTSIPYVGHLLSVAALVINDGGDEDESIGALLHDAPEDQGGRERLADIRARFGERVARIVEGCTDTFEQPKPPWLPRKEQYLAHLEGAPDEVVRVSLADKVDNARAIARDYQLLGEALWERFNPDSDQRWYYTSLLDVFQRRSESSLVDDLERAVREFAPHPSRRPPNRSSV